MTIKAADSINDFFEMLVKKSDYWLVYKLYKLLRIRASMINRLSKARSNSKYEQE